MTPLEQMQELEGVLNSLFEKIQWQGDAEIIELANVALQRLTELKEHEKIFNQIFLNNVIYYI